jgi:hypothetical protein
MTFQHCNRSGEIYFSAMAQFETHTIAINCTQKDRRIQSVRLINGRASINSAPRSPSQANSSRYRARINWIGCLDTSPEPALNSRPPVPRHFA